MDQVLDYDIETVAIGTLNRLLPNWRDKSSGLNAIRREVLLNMSFNMGLTTFREFRKMWIAVKQQDWKEAAKQMMDSTWARQVGRRARELAFAMEFGKFSKGKAA